MKKTHIFGIVVIAVAIGVIISTAGDASSYVTFTQAEQMAQSGKDTKVHVVGELTKNPVGQIVGLEYQPQLDPNYFAFTLVDEEGRQQKVVYRNPMPQDFERSEKVVVIGGYQSADLFVADKILMKCPSKYQENEFQEASIPGQ